MPHDDVAQARLEAPLQVVDVAAELASCWDPVAKTLGDSVDFLDCEAKVSEAGLQTLQRIVTRGDLVLRGKLQTTGHRLLSILPALAWGNTAAVICSDLLRAVIVD